MIISRDLFVYLLSQYNVSIWNFKSRGKLTGEGINKIKHIHGVSSSYCLLLCLISFFFFQVTEPFNSMKRVTTIYIYYRNQNDKSWCLGRSLEDIDLCCLYVWINNTSAKSLFLEASELLRNPCVYSCTSFNSKTCLLFISSCFPYKQVQRIKIRRWSSFPGKFARARCLAVWTTFIRFGRSSSSQPASSTSGTEEKLETKSGVFFFLEKCAKAL